MKLSDSHLGQCRNASAGRFAASMDVISLASSVRSILVRVATLNKEIDVIRRLAADRGTRHEYPHSLQVLSYSRACHPSRTR